MEKKKCPNPPFDLTGRCALITGSASGLGLSYAKALAAAGAAIVMNDIDPERLAKSAAAMRANGCTVHESAFNVADEAAVKAAFAKLDAGNVAVHILVNNAGIQFRKPLLELEARDWQRVMDINLTAAFLVAKEAAGRMVARGEGGKIINIGSLTSELARATTGPLHDRQGWHQDAEPRHDRRMGCAWHFRQHRWTGLHPHRDEQGADREPGIRFLG